MIIGSKIRDGIEGQTQERFVRLGITPYQYYGIDPTQETFHTSFKIVTECEVLFRAGPAEGGARRLRCNRWSAPPPRAYVRAYAQGKGGLQFAKEKNSHCNYYQELVVAFVTLDA